MPPRTISSDDLIDIEQHFKVTAGPGAGKTYWLVKHIKNVLQNSKRLGKSKKIACITYTNAAIDTIRGRLGSDIDLVEVSTIHSFLYKHIVKPFACFLPVEYEVATNLMDGHEAVLVSTKKAKEWLEEHAKRSLLTSPFSLLQLTNNRDNFLAVKNWLNHLSANIGTDGRVRFEGKGSKAISKDGARTARIAGATLNILAEDLIALKRKYWRQGRLDHEDVLFFAYLLLQQLPFIAEAIRSKFPYFYVDEFQDTNPLQYQLLLKIGENETKIGVIGDIAQSIYSFQGASPALFTGFALSEIQQYQILGNRRSTRSVNAILCKIRPDFVQEVLRTEEGTPIQLFVGSPVTALEHAKAMSSGGDVYALARRKNGVKELQLGEDNSDFEGDLLVEMYNVDRPNSQNRYRSQSIGDLIQAVEQARNGKISDAIEQLSVLLRKCKVLNDRKREALRVLSGLFERYATYSVGTLFDFYQVAKQLQFLQLPDLRSGAPKRFYETTTYRSLADRMEAEVGTGLHRTIHSVKGAEFESVFLSLRKDEDLKFLTSPNLSGNEEHRVYYVAVSRAIDRLFIQVPHLSSFNRAALTRVMNIQDL